MKRILLAAAVALTVAPSAFAQVPAGDSVIGSGTARFTSPDLAGLTVPFSIDVRSGPSGEDPMGSLQLLVPFDDPTCLAIRSGGGQVADEAVINFRNTLTGLRVLVRIAGGTSGPRLFSLTQAGSAGDCSFAPPGSVAEVIEGDLSIVDAPALPTSKSQCANGAWRIYGVFKNHGDCVSFVRHQARQECIFIRATHGHPAFRAWYGSGVDKRHAMRRCIRDRSES